MALLHRHCIYSSRSPLPDVSLAYTSEEDGVREGSRPTGKELKKLKRLMSRMIPIFWSDRQVRDRSDNKDIAYVERGDEWS